MDSSHLNPLLGGSNYGNARPLRPPVTVTIAYVKQPPHDAFRVKWYQELCHWVDNYTGNNMCVLFTGVGSSLVLYLDATWKENNAAMASPVPLLILSIVSSCPIHDMYLATYSGNVNVLCIKAHVHIVMQQIELCADLCQLLSDCRRHGVSQCLTSGLMYMPLHASWDYY